MVRAHSPSDPRPRERALPGARQGPRRWGPEVDSSTEALVQLLDDYDLSGFIAEAAAKAWISSDQLAALRRLDAALDQSAADDREGNDAARIAISEWQKVRGVAEAALRSFVTT